MYATFRDKCAVVLSASPGAMGGMRALNPNRQLLMNLGVNVLPSSVAVGGAYNNAFDEETGELTNERQKTMLDGAVRSLFYLARDAANREAACEILKEHMATKSSEAVVGEYGAVSVASS